MSCNSLAHRGRRAGLRISSEVTVSHSMSGDAAGAARGVRHAGHGDGWLRNTVT